MLIWNGFNPLQLHRNLKEASSNFTLQNNSIKYLVFGFEMFIFKVVLVIKRNIMITEQIRTLEYIQEFLGYSSSSKTTEIYTHVTHTARNKIVSPLDNLNLNLIDKKNEKS